VNRSRRRVPLVLVVAWLVSWGLTLAALWANQPPPFVRPLVPAGPLLIYTTKAHP
jgi:hypothetical protein